MSFPSYPGNFLRKFQNEMRKTWVSEPNLKLTPSTENAYGKEAGTLLVDEALCESIFETTNCVDSQKMERWDSELFSGE